MSSARSARDLTDRAAATDRPPATTSAKPQVEAPSTASALVPGQAYGAFTVAPKLDVGASDDVAEVEADQMADRVVARLHDDGARDTHAHGPGCGHPGGTVLRSADAAAAGPIGLAGGAVSAGDEQRISAARAGGRGLPAPVRREMEGAFGADFSAVRVHTGAEASELNQGMSAKAFTVGSDIFFRDGLPDTSQRSGAHLLAHELTHVVQQDGGASRSVRREVVSKGPSDVKIRSGASDTAVPVTGADDAGRAFGAPMKAIEKRGDTTGIGNTTPESPGWAASTPEEKATKEAMPSLASIVIPGVDAKLEAEDPYKAATLHEKHAGKLLQSIQDHDTRIETRARQMEADYTRIVKLHGQYQALGTQGDPAKLKKKKESLEDDVGGKALAKQGIDKSMIWTVVLSVGEERMALAAQARKNANDDVPLVDGVYEMARDDKKAIHDMTGGLSKAHTESHLTAKTSKQDEEGRLKHQRRLGMMGAASGRAQKLGNAVREAHLSESRLFLKRKELMRHGQAIDAAQTTSDWWAAKGKTVGKAVVGAGVSALTAGIVTTEDTASDNKDGKDGAVTKAFGTVGMKPVPVWKRLDAELEKAYQLVDKKPYGVATSFHAGLQVFNAVLREVRNVIAGLATILGLLAAATGPVGAAAIGPVAVTLGLIALGITLFKVAIEAVLATWSGLARAVMSNARNNNLLNTQARSQAAEGFIDLASAATQIGMPMATNAAFAGDGGHGLEAVKRPDQLVADPSQISKVAAPATAGLEWKVAQDVMQTGGSTVAGIGANVVGSQVIQDGKGEQRRQHAARQAPAPTAARPAAVPAPAAVPTAADKEKAVQLQARTQPHAEPKWVKDAKASESDTRSAGIDNLVKKHARNVAQFHDRTQGLMALQKQQAAEAADAKTKVAKAGTKKDEDGALDTVQDMSTKTRTVIGAFDADTAVVGDPKRLQEALMKELKAKLLERGMSG